MKNLFLVCFVFVAVACGGHNTKAGEDGESIVVCDTDADCLNGEECNSQGVCAIPGDDGDKGDTGDRGPAGEAAENVAFCDDDVDCDDGETCNTQGICVEDVEDGEDGAPGEPGEDGEPGPVGPQGETGNTGSQGEPGKDGADGQDADNGDECAGDGDCPQGIACVNGQCVDPNCHGNDDNCLEGEMCDNDVCVPIPDDDHVECNINSDCGARQVCESNCCVDVECTSDSHCSSDEECVGNECVPVEPEPQPEPEPESEPEPQPEPEPVDPSPPSGCVADGQCGAGEYCDAGECVLFCPSGEYEAVTIALTSGMEHLYCQGGEVEKDDHRSDTEIKWFEEWHAYAPDAFDGTYNHTVHKCVDHGIRFQCYLKDPAADNADQLRYACQPSSWSTSLISGETFEVSEDYVLVPNLNGGYNCQVD